MARRLTPPPQPEAATLTAEGIRLGLTKLERRIKELEGFDVKTIEERFDAKTQALRDKINDTIRDIFGHGTVEYNRYSVYSLDTLPLTVGGPRYPLPQVQDAYKKGIDETLVKLRSLKDTLEEKLEDMGAAEVSAPQTPPPGKASVGSRRVFVVHGQDEIAKNQAARFLSQIGLEPVILHEQPSGGRTVIEKLETYIDVEFALVLLTPDDIGHAKDHPEEAKSRARQNVILELGLFLGALGRNRVCALYKGDIEVPSDYQGVVYVPMDDADGWKFLVAREIGQAGLDVDLNKR